MVNWGKYTAVRIRMMSQRCVELLAAGTALASTTKRENRERKTNSGKHTVGSG